MGEYVKPIIKTIVAVPDTCLASSPITITGGTDPFGITGTDGGNFENLNFEDELPW